MEGDGVAKRAASWLLIAATLVACNPVARQTTTPLATSMPLAAAALAVAPAPPPFDTDPHVHFIRQSQRTTGAIAMTPSHTSINPYFANLAARALLHDARHLAAVERYMDWYLAHINPDGTITDYFVRDDQEVSTGTADSTDSYAATFLSLVAAWIKAGGSPAWLAQNGPQLALVAGAIEAVTDTDGLTWAKPGYPLKLLMDNAEVYQGWLDWADLLASHHTLEIATDAAARADRIQAALPSFQRSDATWAWAINLLGWRHWGREGRFYPESVGQLFPFIFGLTNNPGGYHHFDAQHPGWRDLAEGDFPWLLPAYAAAMAGEKEAAREALASVERLYPSLQWPWFIAESAWVLQTAALLQQ